MPIVPPPPRPDPLNPFIGLTFGLHLQISPLVHQLGLPHWCPLPLEKEANGIEFLPTFHLNGFERTRRVPKSSRLRVTVKKCSSGSENCSTRSTLPAKLEIIAREQFATAVLDKADQTNSQAVR